MYIWFVMSLEDDYPYLVFGVLALAEIKNGGLKWRKNDPGLQMSKLERCYA